MEDTACSRFVEPRPHARAHPPASTTIITLETHKKTDVDNPPPPEQTLKFGIGDGHLQYYLFNWRCKEITPEEVGLVLL